jgi:hypothetical protein
MSEPLHTTMVVKVGTSSITDAEGVIDSALVAKLCGEVAGVRVGPDIGLALHGAVVEQGRHRPAVLDEHLGEVAACPQCGVDRVAQERRVEQASRSNIGACHACRSPRSALVVDNTRCLRLRIRSFQRSRRLRMVPGCQ